MVWFDDCVVRCRIDDDSLFDEAEKQLPARFRFASVEAECVFIQVVRQMTRRYGPLMSPQQPAFQQRGNPVNSWQKFRWFFRTTLLKDAIVDETTVFQVSISLPAIRADRAAWFNAGLDEGVPSSHSNGLCGILHGNLM